MSAENNSQKSQDSTITVSKPLAQSKGYRRVLGYLHPYRKLFAAALLCMVVFGATDGGVPFIIKYVLDGVFAHQDKGLLAVVPLILISFALVRALADFGQQYLAAKVGHYVVSDMRRDLHTHLLTLPPSFFVRNSSADLVARLSSDVALVRGLVTDSAASIIRDSIRIIALIISAIYLDPLLALIAFVAFPIGIYPVVRFGKKMRQLSRRGQEGIGALSALLQETVLGNRVVKSFAREQFEQERFARQNERLTRTFISSERVRAITGPINEVLASLAISAVILYGGWTVIGGDRTQGEFIAFLIAVFLLYDPFKKLSRVHNTVQQGMAGADRIFELLDAMSPIVEPAQPKPLGARNGIDFADVFFSYPGESREALSDISLFIPEGKKVALVGLSGAGKSTLVDLISRFIDPSRGIVKIGGVNVAETSLSELRQRIAVVGQHTFLFNDSVLNNIAYGKPGASEEEIREAASRAHALDFIERLPKGFDTPIGEGGLALSGGERQRIAIARAILKGAPILILDEATASLDNQSEREVQLALEQLEAGRTTVVIAHRLSTVRNADLIVVMKDGHIVERGTHEALLHNTQGEYAKLYRLQFAMLEEQEAHAS